MVECARYVKVILELKDSKTLVTCMVNWTQALGTVHANAPVVPLPMAIGADKRVNHGHMVDL